jgi:glycosyltransferase involved in cell wall biosynthesis
MGDCKTEKKIGLIAHMGEDFIKSRLDFVLYLHKLGYNTFAIIPEDTYKGKILNAGIKVYFYKYIRSWRCFFYMVDTIVKFSIIIKKEKPDAIFTYKFFPNLIGIYIANKLKINKIIGTVAGLGFLEKHDRSLIINLIFRLYIYILNKATYIIIQNNDDKNLLNKYIIEKKLILINGSGVSKSTFSIQDDVYIRAKWGLKEDHRYFIFSSRIDNNKGLLELIKAFNNISKTVLNTGLIIIGWFDDIGIKEKVLKEIGNNNKIYFFGYQEDVRELIGISDCAVLLSYAEGLPRSLLDAMALAKPIITTDCKGCRETCMNGINGFLVKQADVKDTEEKLLQFLNLDDNMIKQMGKASYKLFNEKFEQSIVFKTIITNVL